MADASWRIEVVKRNAQAKGRVAQGMEKANIIANDRIVAEAVGVIMAGLAVYVMQWWITIRGERHHVRARQIRI